MSTYYQTPAQKAEEAQRTAVVFVQTMINHYDATDCTCGGTGNPFQPHLDDCAKQQAWVPLTHHKDCERYICRPGCHILAWDWIRAQEGQAW